MLLIKKVIDRYLHVKLQHFPRKYIKIGSCIVIYNSINNICYPNNRYRIEIIHINLNIMLSLCIPWFTW